MKIISKFRWESGFLKGVPLCTNGKSEYLMQLSVKDTNRKIYMLLGKKGFQKMKNLSLFLLSSNRSIQAMRHGRVRPNLIIGLIFPRKIRSIRKQNSVSCTTSYIFF